MLKPDYHGGSIVNLMASITQGLGLTANGYTPFAGLTPQFVSEYQNVVLLVLDGLGYHYLKNKVPKSFLAQHINFNLTSVFPSTTASAITTFASAQAPQQHAITGWHMYFEELQQVIAVLPFHPRDPQVKNNYELETMQQVLELKSIMNLINRQHVVISPKYIIDSNYNRIISGNAQRIGYKGLNHCFNQIAEVCKTNRDPKYIYAYWPDFDSCCHQYGVDSAEALSLFDDLDSEIQMLLDRLAGQNYLLLVTADHGLIDSSAEKSLLLNDYPEIIQHLTHPLCGEPRVAYCYVKPGHESDFKLAIQRHLSNSCDLLKSSDVIEQGLFGLGVANKNLTHRIGNYMLLMKQNYIIKDLMPEEKAFSPKGVHGGLSPEEMQVPLMMFSN